MSSFVTILVGILGVGAMLGAIYLAESYDAGRKPEMIPLETDERREG